VKRPGLPQECSTIGQDLLSPAFFEDQLDDFTRSFWFWNENWRQGFPMLKLRGHMQRKELMG
jgi:hypothetical protein